MSRRFVVTVAALALVAAAAVPAGASSTTATVAAAGTTTVTANGPHAVTLHVPRATSVDLTPDATFENVKGASATGNAPVTGFVLTRHPSGDHVTTSADVIAFVMRLGFCWDAPCTTSTPHRYFVLAPTTPTLDVPKGDYDLYVLGTGPGSVTVRFAGLTGRRTVPAPRVVRSSQWLPTSVIAGTSAEVASFNGDTTMTLHGPGEIVNAHYLLDGKGVYAASDCFSALGEGDTLPSPVCPGLANQRGSTSQDAGQLFGWAVASRNVDLHRGDYRYELHGTYDGLPSGFLPVTVTLEY